MTAVIYLCHIPIPFQSQCCVYLKRIVGALKLVKILKIFFLSLSELKFIY